MPYEDYNIDHLIHHIANLSYTTSIPCKNKLDGSNTLLLNYVASMVALQTVATYVTIEHRKEPSEKAQPVLCVLFRTAVML